MKAELFGAGLLLLGGIALIYVLIATVLQQDWPVAVVCLLGTIADFYGCYTMLRSGLRDETEPA